MPQPKPTSRSGSAPRKRTGKAAKPAASKAAKQSPEKAAKPAAKESPTKAESSATREQLARFLTPLDLVLLTRERIQGVLDDAVARGRMTRADAAELATALFERGRRQTEDLLADIEQLLGRSREPFDEAHSDAKRRARSRVTGPADRVMREVDRARRAAGIGTTFPISNYDDLTAAQVTGRLGELTPAELRKVRDYEQRNANRKSVLAAVDQKLG